ncbi:MAG: hypothetical protein ACRDRO_21210 [Pseudonocardiaceae bacterium]
MNDWLALANANDPPASVRAAATPAAAKVAPNEDIDTSSIGESVTSQSWVAAEQIYFSD